jgi:hypothetical protein
LQIPLSKPSHIRHSALIESIAERAQRQVLKLKALDDTLEAEKRRCFVRNADDLPLVAFLLKIRELRGYQETKNFGIGSSATIFPAFQRFWGRGIWRRWLGRWLISVLTS